jgi:phage gp45-like
MIRGTIKRSDATTSTQQLQLELLDDETDEDIELFESGGVSFRAYADADVLVAELGSSANRVAFLPSARGKRPTTAIEEGEGGLYFAGVYRVFVKNDGTARLGTYDATEAAMKGDQFKTEYDVHTHASPFGPTGAPIVLMSAASLSTIVKIG